MVARKESYTTEINNMEHQIEEDCHEAIEALTLVVSDLNKTIELMKANNENVRKHEAMRYSVIKHLQILSQSFIACGYRNR